MNPVSEAASRRRTRKRIISSPILTVGLLVIVLLFGRAAFGMIWKAQQASDALAEAETKLSKIEASRNALEKEATALATESGLESELRARFSVARLGEEVVVIVEPDLELAAPVEASGFWKSLWSSMSGWF